MDTKTVPVKKCCTNPFWLYRIYQDTEVTTSEVIAIVRDGLSESRSFLAKIHSINVYQPTEIIPTKVKEFECVRDGGWNPGDFSVRWKSPWNGAVIIKWVLFIDNTQHLYDADSSVPAMTVPGLFNPGTLVRFFVRPYFGDGVEGSWSVRGECNV